VNTRTPHRDAIRISFILNAGSVQWVNPNDATVAKIFKGEARLHAFDFWISNPDYLASELLDSFEAIGNAQYREAAEAIFQSDESDLRRIPMIRDLPSAVRAGETGLKKEFKTALAGTTGV